MALKKEFRLCLFFKQNFKNFKSFKLARKFFNVLKNFLSLKISQIFTYNNFICIVSKTLFFISRIVVVYEVNYYVFFHISQWRRKFVLTIYFLVYTILKNKVCFFGLKRQVINKIFNQKTFVILDDKVLFFSNLLCKFNKRKNFLARDPKSLIKVRKHSRNQIIVIFILKRNLTHSLNNLNTFLL